MNKKDYKDYILAEKTMVKLKQFIGEKIDFCLNERIERIVSKKLETFGEIERIIDPLKWVYDKGFNDGFNKGYSKCTKVDNIKMMSKDEIVEKYITNICSNLKLDINFTKNTINLYKKYKEIFNGRDINNKSIVASMIYMQSYIEGNLVYKKKITECLNIGMVGLNNAYKLLEENLTEEDKNKFIQYKKDINKIIGRV